MKIREREEGTVITKQSSHRLYANIHKIILKFIWKVKGTRIAKIILKRKTKVEGITLPNFKTYKIATIIKTAVLWRDKHVDQWNRTQNPNINPCRCS